jgi:hypothetical protein
MNYKCVRCKKVFKGKASYDRHLKRKTPCEEKEEVIPEPKMVWISIAGSNYSVPQKSEQEQDQAVEVNEGETEEEALFRFYGGC